MKSYDLFEPQYVALINRLQSNERSTSCFTIRSPGFPVETGLTACVLRSQCSDDVRIRSAENGESQSDRWNIIILRLMLVRCIRLQIISRGFRNLFDDVRSLETTEMPKGQASMLQGIKRDSGGKRWRRLSENAFETSLNGKSN